jgi:succinate-semialdehyde dehydrogenase/glutarate-semialdehyde dehydrogenase
MNSIGTFERALGRRNTRTSFEEIQRVLGPIPLGPVVGGKPLDGDGVIAVVNPATEEVITEIANGTVAEAASAVEVAQQAQEAWAEVSPRSRSEILRRAFDLMTERAEALARLIVLENGKALPDARSEVAYAAEFFRWYAEEAVRLGGVIEHAPAGTNKIMVLRQPIGVSLLITPWNFPAAMATRKIGPALAAGCSVILKPHPRRHSLHWRSWRSSPRPACRTVSSTSSPPPGPTTSARRCSTTRWCARCRSPGRPRSDARSSSTRPAPSSVPPWSSAATRPSSSCPTLTWARPSAARSSRSSATAALPAPRRTASSCTPRSADEFIRRFAEAVGSLQVGPGLDEATKVGPLVNAKTRDKVVDLVQSALDAGAAPVTGGSAPDRAGYFYTPTVLGGVPQDAEILSQEIFGPVAPVVAYDDLDEAVALANNTEYGLVSYVYTRDLRTGLRVAERLDSGMVGLNRPVVSDPAAPFGGTKQSGLGREGGHEGMLEFTGSKYVAVEW